MSQAQPCIEYDPSCVECRRDAGKDAAGTTWQCIGHAYLERDRLRALLATAQAERDALQASLDSWVAWAQSSRCIYCGQEFIHDPHDQTGADEAKKVHVLTCAKHPMAQTQAALTEAHRMLRECHEVLANLGYITDDDDPESLCARVAAVLAQEEPS